MAAAGAAWWARVKGAAKVAKLATHLFIIRVNGVFVGDLVVAKEACNSGGGWGETTLGVNERERAMM